MLLCHNFKASARWALELAAITVVGDPGPRENTRFYQQPTDDSAGSHKPIPANGLRRNVVSEPIVKGSCCLFFGESGNQQAPCSNGVLIVQNSCRRTG